MKIGIAVGDVRGRAALAEIVNQIQTAAYAGFSTAWSSQALDWDALTTLAVAGGRVSGINLGTAVVPIPQRHPLVLASQALTVQAATGNRLTLGIGAGIATMVETMFGLPSDRPVRRVREYLAVLEPLLRGETVTHQGETLKAMGAVHVPGARPPSVLVAALGPAMLSLAGELADGTITWMTGPKTLTDHIVPSITKAAATGGRPAPRVVAGLLTCVTNNADAVRDRVTDQFALAGQVPEYRAMLDREGVASPGDVVIAGDEDTVTRHLDRLSDAGVTEFMAVPYGTAEEQHRTTNVLAELAKSHTRLEHLGTLDENLGKKIAQD
jgi:F420-dependent oxidoreductase-like protein